MLERVVGGQETTTWCLVVRGLGGRTLRFPACWEGTGEHSAPHSSALSCQGLSLIPRDYSSIQQTRSACLTARGRARPWQEDSLSPPQRQWAASVTGIFFLPLSLCPSHPPSRFVRPPLFPTSPSTDTSHSCTWNSFPHLPNCLSRHPSVLGSGEMSPSPPLPPGSPSGSEAGPGPLL